MLSPAVVDFFETALRRGNDALNIEDLAVSPDSPGLGKTLEGLDIRGVTGATVLAILRDGNPLVSPPGDLALAAGDRLLALGTGDQLRRLEKLIAAGTAR
jgi:voltage-gated potassium channel